MTHGAGVTGFLLVLLCFSRVAAQLPDEVSATLPASEVDIEETEALEIPQSPPTTASTLDELVQRLQNAEKRIAEMEISESVDLESTEESKSTRFPDESKRRLEELWSNHQDKKNSNRPSVQMFGRMHLEALGFPNTSPGIANFENPITGTDVEDRIQFRRIRLGAQGKIRDTGLYRIEFDLGNPSRSTFRDTYVGFEELPVFQTLLIGNQKRPFGLDAWNSNQHVVFFERPLVINAFNPNFRRLGIESYGHSDGDILNWQFGAFELEDVKGIGRDIGSPLHFSLNARFATAPWYDETSEGRSYWHLGVANMYATTASSLSASGNNGDLASFNVRPELQTTNPWIDTGTLLGATDYNSTGLETVLNLGSLQLQGEYLTTTVDRQRDSYLNFHGGYLQAAYFLTGEYMPWDRKSGRLARPKPRKNFFAVRNRRDPAETGWGAWQIAARWSYLSLCDRDVQGGRQEDITLGLNWYWTTHSKLMLNLVDGRIQDRTPINGFSNGTFTGAGIRILMDF
ncbi:Porin P precursor [Pirellula sp. SH-Sr6A]|uniref:OprO/OprP family phosphate-selective porin n=1 Tax=Pirellula sp. SH-Sr6A TaxID=1632865 RepID=UPI00078D9C71|nr:porin [Pirellula sp. SH-Sr6A]AMV34806.1 Porin P precursor [Pirellula sp. SH-Sr6A]